MNTLLIWTAFFLTTVCGCDGGSEGNIEDALFEHASTSDVIRFGDLTDGNRIDLEQSLDADETDPSAELQRVDGIDMDVDSETAKTALGYCDPKDSTTWTLGGKEPPACMKYFCDDEGILYWVWSQRMSPCSDLRSCLTNCGNGVRESGCGWCQEVEDGDDMECVPSNEQDLAELDFDPDAPDAEPTKDGCSTANPCTYSRCIQKDGGMPECGPAKAQPDQSPCNDNDACTFGDRCWNGTCQINPAGDTESGLVDCDDGNPCTDDSRENLAHQQGESVAYECKCVHEPAELATGGIVPCNDDDKCTTDDQCLGGFCLGHPRECDDHNPCTEDLCDPSTPLGCVHGQSDEGSACEDGLACTTQDTCSNGMCVGGDTVQCPTTYPCQTATCEEVVQDDDVHGFTCNTKVEAGYCVIPPSAGLDEASCIPVGSTEVPCFECHAGQEVAAQVSQWAPCDDGSDYTGGDACRIDEETGDWGCFGTPCDLVPLPSCLEWHMTGECHPMSVLKPGFCLVGNSTCLASGDNQPGNPCSTCVENPVTGESDWAPLADFTIVDDGDPATVGDYCLGGQVVSGIPSACPVFGDCANPHWNPDGSCGIPQRIDDSQCLLLDAGGHYRCFVQGQLDPENPCLKCHPGSNTWVPVETGYPCSDDQGCTFNDRCDGAGHCFGTQVDCEFGNPCITAWCDFTAAKNSGDPACNITSVSSDGVACVNQSGVWSQCLNGACWDACNDQDPCTSDFKDPDTGTCFHEALCEDSDPCTVDTCEESTGACVHSVAVCNDGNPCTEDFCDPTEGCTGLPVMCPPSDDPCSTNVCDPDTGQCLPEGTPEGTECTDGDGGTAMDACDGAGSCVGGVLVGNTVLSFENGGGVRFPVAMQGQNMSVAVRFRPLLSGTEGLVDLWTVRKEGSSRSLKVCLAQGDVAIADAVVVSRGEIVLLLLEGDNLRGWKLPGNASLEAGVWTGLGIVVEAGTPRMIITSLSKNGEMVPLTSMSTWSPLEPGDYELILGADGEYDDGAGFRGEVAKVAFWDEAVSPGPSLYTYPNLYCETVGTQFDLPDTGPSPLVFTRGGLFGGQFVDNDGLGGVGVVESGAVPSSGSPISIPSTDVPTAGCPKAYP